MAGRKKRNSSQREPIGKTKSQILLFIADREKCDYTEIREYLRSSLNVRNQKGIRGHLSGLFTENLIKKESQGKGMSDAYFVESNFSTFRRDFNFLNENDFSLDFLKTKYAKDMIVSDDFFFYGLVNILKLIGIDLFDLMNDEKKFNELLNECKKETIDTNQIEIMQEQREKISDSNVQELISVLRTKSPEELLDFIGNEFKLAKYPMLIANQLFPVDTRKEIMNIISSSRSALDYFLNLKIENKLAFFIVLFRFFISIFFVDPSKAALLQSFNQLREQNFTNEVIKLIPNILDMQNVLNDNPILTTLKAYFIIDSVNAKIVENEYSTETLSKILIPEVKQ